MTRLRVVGRRLLGVVDGVLVAPLRRGVLRPAGWPPGLAAILGLGLTAYVVAVVVVLFGGLIRARSPLEASLGGDLTLPRATLFLFVVLVVIALALLHTATMHLPVWARVGGVLLVVLALLNVAVVSAERAGPARITTWVGAAAVVALTLVRWRATFAWWEFVASLAVIGGTYGVAMRFTAVESQPLGFDVVPLIVTQTMQLVGQLAIPASFVAGLAFAQLTVSASHRVGEAVDGRARWLVGAVAVLALVRVVVSVRHLGSATQGAVSHAHELGSAVVLLALTAALSVTVLGLRRSRGRLPSLAGLDETIGDIALPAAVILTASVIPALVVSRLGAVLMAITDSHADPLAPLRTALLSTTTVVVVRVGGGLLLLGYAGWLRHRGRPAAALLSGLVGLVVLALYLRRLTDGAAAFALTDDAVNDVASSLTVLALAWFAVRRELTPVRVRALGIALVLSLAYALRSSFDVPLTALLGISGTATVIVGLIWSMLTEGAGSTRGSARYPTPARVLLFLGNGLFAVTALAFLSIAKAPALGIDISAFADLGDAFLGTALLLAAYVIIAWTCFVTAAPSAPDVDPEPVAPEPVDPEPVDPEPVAPELGVMTRSKDLGFTPTPGGGKTEVRRS